MSALRRTVWAAIIAVPLGAGFTFAGTPSTEPSKQDLVEKINQMQTQMDQMKSQLDAQQKQVDPRDEAAAIAQVLRDADQHSKMLDSMGSVQAGWNPDKMQFFIGDGDAFYLHPGVIFQFRYAGDYRSKPNDFTSGFEVRRMKFVFDGNVFSKDLVYKFQWQDGNNGGAPTLEYGYMQYTFAHNVMGGDLALRAGQYKDPLIKEEAGVGDTNQLMVERSLANATVGGLAGGGPLIQGLDLMLMGKENPLHMDMVFHDGIGSGNADYTNGAGAGVVPATDFGAAVRADYKVTGDWTDAGDFTGVNSGKHDLLVIGGGADFTQSAGTNSIRYTADAQYQTSQQIALYGALYGDYIDFRGAGAGPHSRSDFGGVIEGGYRLNNAWQLVARYSITAFDSRFKVGGENIYNELGVGVNYFMGPGGAWGNHAKISADLNYLPQGSPLGGSNGLDYTASTTDNDAIIFRVQFQMFI